MTARTVLLVDDSRVARMMTRNLIARAAPGLTIVEAASGDEAIAAASGVAGGTPPDYILLDVNMPGMDGLTAAGHLLRLCPDASISLLTANIQDAVRHRAEELGIGFISKPPREEALVSFLSSGRVGA